MNKISVVPQLRNVDGSRFVKKEKYKGSNNNNDRNNNNDNVTEALNNHSDDSVYLLVLGRNFLHYVWKYLSYLLFNGLG